MSPTVPVDDPFLSLSDGATEIALVRHGNALPPPEEIADGGYDEQHLSLEGRDQAGRAAQALRRRGITTVWSSPTLRAFETAQIIAATSGLNVQIDDGLREVDLTSARPTFTGEDSPATRAAALRAYMRDIERRAMTVGVWSQIIGPGVSEAIRARMALTIESIASRHPGERVAVVSHAGAINAYFAVALGLALDFFFPTAYTSISTVRLKGQYRLVVSLNVTEHLLS